MVIFLTILKWIGIILLCILGLVLLLVLLTLFSPLTYNVHVEGSKEKVKVVAKLGWFFYIIRPIITFEDNELSIKVRFFGIPINLSGGNKRSERPKPEATFDPEPAKEPAEILLPEENEPVEAEVTDIVEVTEESEAFTEAEDTSTEEDKDRLKAEQKEAKKRKREETKEKVKKMMAKAKKLWAYLQEEETKTAIALIKDVIKKVLKHVMPRKFKGHLNLGFEDPSDTGLVLGAVAAVYPAHRGNLGITPIFDTDEMIIDGEARIRGHVFIIFFLVQGLRVLRNKRIMSLIKKAMR